MRTAMYLRKSRAEEAGDSVEVTLRKHHEILLDFARHNGLSIVKIYEEVVSGDSLVARPQMLRLLEDVEAGQYDAVLCMDIDRLGRGAMSDQGVILETFKAADVKIITPRKVYDLNNELDEEYTEFETFMARRELKLIKRRLQRGTRKALEEGAYVCEPPYGYTRAMVGKRSTLAIQADEAAFVRMMFDMYKDGIGCQTIADTINGMGAKPHRAAQFGRTSVRKILKNQVYIGKVVWGSKSVTKKGGKRVTTYHPPEEWRVSDGLHPPIVDEETFGQVQRIFDGRWHPPYNNGQVENPMAGVIRCSVCGQKLQRRPYKAKGDAEHMICPTRGCCCASRMDRVEAALLQEIRRQLDALVIQRDTGGQEDAGDYRKLLQGAQKELATLQSQKDRLHDLLEQGVYTIDTFLERSARLEDQIKDSRSAVRSIEDKITAAARRDRGEVIARVRNVLQAYESADPPERNRMLKSIVQSAVYYKEKGWPPEQFILRVQLLDTD